MVYRSAIVIRARRGLRTLVVGAAALVAGCPGSSRPRPTAPTKTVHVRAVSEAAAVRVVAAVGSYYLPVLFLLGLALVPFPKPRPDGPDDNP